MNRLYPTVAGAVFLAAIVAVASTLMPRKDAPAVVIKRESPPESVEEILQQIRTSLNTREIGVLGGELRAMMQDRLAEELERSHVSRGMICLIVPALAKLGDRNAEKLILAGLQSENAASRSRAMHDAAFARTPALVAALGDMLFSEAPSVSYADVTYRRPSLIAARLLATVVENPPVPPIGHDKKNYTHEDVRIWREWWQSSRGIVVDDVYERSKEFIYPKQHR